MSRLHRISSGWRVVALQTRAKTVAVNRHFFASFRLEAFELHHSGGAGMQRRSDRMGSALEGIQRWREHL